MEFPLFLGFMQIYLFIFSRYKYTTMQNLVLQRVILK